MGKIVIPKHSADLKEMDAVLKIHYDAKDWVKGTIYTKKIKEMIGADQYPSSYPKKAQVPTYFGFVECKMTQGGRITERRITDSGIKMYEAIINNDRKARQELLLSAIEKMIFGRNNGGCISSESDIDAPNLIIRCILDTGFCTSKEYAYMVWNLNDNGKKYFKSLAEIISARSRGGIVLPSNIPDYTDWKPILALVRWGFLIKADDEVQKILIHPDVIDQYAERLNKIKVYNVDKYIEDGEEIQFNDEIVDTDKHADTTVFKPFKLVESTSEDILQGRICEVDQVVEKQNIFPGDNVLLVDSSISRLLAYYSYQINSMVEKEHKYEIGIQAQQAINQRAEDKILEGLREEEKKKSSQVLTELLKKLFHNNLVEKNISMIKDNKDIEPVNLLIRALLQVDSLSKNEIEYLLTGITVGDINYSDIIDKIISSRRKNELLTCSDSPEKYFNFEFIKELENQGLFDLVLINGEMQLVISSSVKEKFETRLKRLSIYAVDIMKLNQEPENSKRISMPRVIKPLFLDNDFKVESEENILRIINNGKVNMDCVQGNYVVIVDKTLTDILYPYVFQIQTMEEYQVTLIRRLVIRTSSKQEILNQLKENI